MLENQISKWKKQIEQIEKEVENKHIKKKRREELIEDTKRIARELDELEGLEGTFIGYIESQYDGQHPRRRIKNVLTLLKQQLGIEDRKEEKE